jgi:arylsulfatase
MLASNRPIEPARAEQSASAGGAKPNILVIMGDDIGWSNIGAYNQGLMAGQSNTGKTPGNGLSGGVGQMR